MSRASSDEPGRAYVPAKAALLWCRACRVRARARVARCDTRLLRRTATPSCCAELSRTARARYELPSTRARRGLGDDAAVARAVALVDDEGAYRQALGRAAKNIDILSL